MTLFGPNRNRLSNGNRIENLTNASGMLVNLIAPLQPQQCKVQVCKLRACATVF